MNPVKFSESDMEFGPFPPQDFYGIEKSQAHSKLGNGVKIAEFLLIRPKTNGTSLWVVEAKSSFPQPGNQPRFDEAITEIREKLTNAFSLGFAVILGRHPAAASELPVNFKSLDLKGIQIRLILVVKGHKDDWLPPLRDSLKTALRLLQKTWALEDQAVWVMNEVVAKKYGLISGLTPKD